MERVAADTPAASRDDPLDLFDLVAETGALPESVTVHYFLRLLSATELATAASGRDPCLCPERIVLSMDGDVLIKSDEASWLPPATTDAARSSPYGPPDVNPDPAKDAVWSLGVLLFCMLAGYPPFAEASARCEYFAAYAETNEMEFPHTFSWRAVHLLCRMLALAPASRIGFPEVRRLALEWQQDPKLTDAKPSDTCAEHSSADETTLDGTIPLRRSKRQRQQVAGGMIATGDAERVPLPMLGVAIPVVNSPRSEWPRRRDLCPQPPAWKPQAVGRRALRHLGWEGMAQPVPQLFERLHAAILRIGLQCKANRDNWSLLARPSSNSSETDGLAIEAWVAVGSCQRHAICVKRVYGDTFVFHSFCAQKPTPHLRAVASAITAALPSAAPLPSVPPPSLNTACALLADRRLREEMADLIGWADGAYRGAVVPGVAPKWHLKLRQLLSRLQEASSLAELPAAAPAPTMIPMETEAPSFASS